MCSPPLAMNLRCSLLRFLLLLFAIWLLLYATGCTAVRLSGPESSAVAVRFGLSSQIQGLTIRSKDGPSLSLAQETSSLSPDQLQLLLTLFKAATNLPGQ